MSCSLYDLRRSASEILAFAFLDLFPGALLVEGKAHEFGFYYEFLAEQPVDSHALPLLEEKMRGLIKTSQIRTVEMMRENAASLLDHREQPLRAQAVADCRENIVSLLQIDDFYDFCDLPHVFQAEDIGAIKLLDIEKVSRFFPGEGEGMVVRIHGTAAKDKAALKAYVKALQAGKKRDHRPRAKTWNLFEIQAEVSDLSFEWLSNGVELRERLLAWWRSEHRQQQFRFVQSPAFVKESLLQSAGYEGEEPTFHEEFDGVKYRLAESFGPAHASIFRSKPREFSELPLRIAECGLVNQPQKRGQLWGIFDVQTVWADEAHIFCLPEQVEKELISSLQFIVKCTKMFGFECHWHLRGQAHKSAGTPASWKKGIESFVTAFEQCGLAYEFASDGEYRGPSAQVRLVDAAGREWNGPMLGLDFSIPERLKLRYRTVEGKERPPIVIVRSIFGSLERFIGLLIEHVDSEKGLNFEIPTPK